MKGEQLPQIPTNHDAERSVLEVIFAAPERLGEAAEKLNPEDFHHSLYRKIFMAALHLEAERRQIDAITIGQLLSEDGELKSAGGVTFLCTLGDLAHKRAALPEYCRIVKEAAQRRQLQHLLNHANENLTDSEISNNEIEERIEVGLSALREESAGRSAMHVADIIREIGPILDRVVSGKGIMLGTPTGFSRLDNLTAGWISGEMVVLAARPSAGKTAFASEVALRQVRNANAVAIFSLEMSRASLLLRLACREAGVSYHRLCSGWLSSADTSKLCAAIARIGQLPIWIDDRPAMSALDLRWRLRSLAQRHSIKLAVVDYLQLLRAKAENRTQEITKISMELKAAARELGEISDGTLLAISQLNRMATKERPQLHHLRESGQIEQDADAVLLLYDAELMALGQSDPNSKILEVVKQRNGPCGCVPLTFLPAVMGFEPASQDFEFEDHKSAAVGEDPVPRGLNGKSAKSPGARGAVTP